MYKTGVYFGRFCPPHRGHLYQMIEASTQCEKLIVVISDNANQTREICESAGLPMISYQLRKQWISQQIQDMEHIVVRVLDETDIPEYPNGWVKWSERMRQVVSEPIDAFFVGDMDYQQTLEEYFPEAKVELFDPSRTRYPISATDIRHNILGNWHYILGSARPFFAKKVLIAGTESCGKTTLTKCLAKLYNTSWSEEVGRYYARDYLGNDETIFTDVDFGRIAHLQYEQDYHALRTANKVCFFDTDATYTDYFSELYMGRRNPLVQAYIDPSRYDLLLYLLPDVKWVSDGQRLHGDQEKRMALSKHLQEMYIAHGFGDKLVVVGGTYNERLTRAIELVDALLPGIAP
ncbi:MAG: multifunctional transcriptional regulator/nicotinamide-nucleotide adenylyltransferase/ribosylnicotinamide kinase NadR [Candidatus Limiplasma sp.]|nr:multifunctional transcriptional regulator/nicotinamide-nucleotide adenylyltransferase/ribosylnicotinamide kinase NadR [Candidatus Limiplasma sp.]